MCGKSVCGSASWLTCPQYTPVERTASSRMWLFARLCQPSSSLRRPSARLQEYLRRYCEADKVEVVIKSVRVAYTALEKYEGCAKGEAAAMFPRAFACLSSRV